MRSFIRHHPIGTGIGAVALLAGLAWLAFGFFAVHTLFIDDVVDEAAPAFDATPAATTTPATPTPPTTSRTTTPPTSGGPEGTVEAQPSAENVSDTVADDPAPVSESTTPPAAPEVAIEFAGTFVGKAHPTDGTASVLGNGTGQRFVRFEQFETDNGPDLNVYLVNSSTGDVSDYIDLGDLKGNIGDQNYEVPEEADISVYDTVVIWCVRFSVSFGEAALTAT
jgi:Electron transfer DM13